MVEAVRKAIRLRAAMRNRDLRIGTSGCAMTPPVGVPDCAAPSTHSLTARELIRMAQAARRASSVTAREG